MHGRHAGEDGEEVAVLGRGDGGEEEELVHFVLGRKERREAERREVVWLLSVGWKTGMEG